MKNKKATQKWQAVDWSQDIALIAQQMKVSERTAYARKRKQGIAPKAKGRKTSVNWQSVDWSQTSQTIADQLGMSKGHIDKKRLDVNGVTQSVNWDFIDWSKDLTQIASETDRGIDQVTNKYKEWLNRGQTLSDKGVKNAAELITKYVLLNATEDANLAVILGQFSAQNANKIRRYLAVIANGVTSANTLTLYDYVSIG